MEFYVAKTSIIFFTLKEKFLFLCTCIGLEIMTSVGVIGYLIYLNKPILALISMIVFGKLIIFHFIMEFLNKKIQII